MMLLSVPFLHYPAIPTPAHASTVRGPDLTTLPPPLTVEQHAVLESLLVLTRLTVGPGLHSKLGGQFWGVQGWSR